MEAPFVCQVGIELDDREREAGRKACDGLQSYGEHKDKQYCVLHFPSKDKEPDFQEAIREKRTHNDFDFSGVYFPAFLDFEDFEFTFEADFSNATFEDAAYFFGAKFKESVNFEGATFKGDIEFSGATFAGEANFSEATFEGWTSFPAATFSDAASFIASRFQGHTSFGGATFSKVASFYHARFDSETDFSGVSFKEKASFSWVFFGKKADFSFILSATVFEEEADFLESTFQEEAIFVDATFKDNATFLGTTFGGRATFFRATFERDVDFTNATFKERVGFSALTAFNPQAVLKLNYATMERPELVSFNTVELRPSWFIYVNAQNFDFHNIQWHELRAGANSMLGSEADALRERGFGAPYPSLARTYSELRNNYEAKRDYSSAGEFHYWSMEALRKEGFRRIGLVASLYWALSGYGERPYRAVGVLVGMCAAFAVLYMLLGPCELHGLGQAMVYSLGSVARLNPEPRPDEPGLFQFFVIVEGLLGPLQLALLALAVRRKVMR